MDDKNESLKLQINFSRTNGFIAVLIACFYLFLKLFGQTSKDAVIFGTFAVAALLFDSMIGIMKYFHNLYVVRGSRILVCFVLSISMFEGKTYQLTKDGMNGKTFFCMCMIFLLLSFAYCAICIEHMFMFELTDRYYQINAVIEMAAPIGLVTMFEYIFSENMESADIMAVIALLVAITGIFFSVLHQASGVVNNFFEKLFRQERIAINSKEEANNLKLYQSKLVRANEQLSRQKVQLEIANATITRSITEMQLQHMLVKHINSMMDSNKIIDFITKGLEEALNLDLCAVIIRKIDSLDESEELFLSVNSSSRSCLGENVEQSIRDSEFIKMYGILPGATYVADNKVPDSKYDFLIGSNIGSLLIYPMKVQENTTGVLIVGKNAYGYFKQNISFYETIVEQIILALRNAFMYTQMQDMAIKDALTTIYNRRYFNSIFPEFAQKAVEQKRDMTVVLFDIDHFKRINDRYGHIFGDKVIKFCGKVAGAYAEKYNGFAVRYGGEEFVISFLDKKAAEVYDIVEQMHRELKEYEFICEGQAVHINVSTGITSYPDICSNINDLLNRADLTMYSSKKKGRGKITVDSPELMNG